MTLSDEKLKELEKALLTEHSICDDDSAVLLDLDAFISIQKAARAFSQIAPLLKQWLTARELATGGTWWHEGGVRVDTHFLDLRSNFNDAMFCVVSANTATEIGRIICPKS